MDVWAEIRRLHRSEQIPIKQIARDLGIGRNTVRRALRGEDPPDPHRGPRGSKIDPFVPQIRALLAEYPKMPASVIAERVGWTYSGSLFRERVSELRPEYQGIDPADRLSYTAGEVIQCDLWFPETRIPVGDGQDRMLPVLVMVSGFSRRIEAIMLPSRQGGDLTSGMWALLQRFGGVPRSLLWDREAAIGGLGKPTILAATFAGPSRPGSGSRHRGIRKRKASSSERTDSWKPRSCPDESSRTPLISTPSSRRGCRSERISAGFARSRPGRSSSPPSTGPG